MHEAAGLGHPLWGIHDVDPAQEQLGSATSDQHSRGARDYIGAGKVSLKGPSRSPR